MDGEDREMVSSRLRKNIGKKAEIILIGKQKRSGEILQVKDKLFEIKDIKNGAEIIPIDDVEYLRFYGEEDEK